MATPIRTRQQKRDIFSHIMLVLDQLDDTYPIWQAFVKANYVGRAPYAFITISPDEIATFRCDQVTTDANGADHTVEVPLHSSDQTMIKLFQDWIKWLVYDARFDATSVEAWLALDRDVFDIYRIQGFKVPPPPSSHNNSSHPVQSKPPPDPVREFHKSVKRDLTVFSVLKNDTQWDTYQRSLIANARTQDVYDVIDPRCAPPTPNANCPKYQLYQAKLAYLYSVFERTLLTDTGKASVRRHEATFDARAIYIEVKQNAESSTKSSLDASKLLSWLTTTKLGTSTWNGTTHAFILFWLEQLRLYHNMISITDHLSDALQRQMLENAVHDIPDLRNVKIQADHLRAFDGRTTTFNQYLNLLKSAAISYDSNFLPRGSASTKRRTVYLHDLGNDTDVDDVFDVDTPLDTVLAYSTIHQRTSAPTASPSSTRLPPPQWTCLSPDGKVLWRQLSPADKAAILGKSTHPGSIRQANSTDLHPISSEATDHFVDALDAIELDPGPPNDPSPHIRTIDANATATSAKPAHPGDLRRLMSSTHNPPPQRPAPNSLSSRTDHPPEMTINGVRYRSVNITSITYDVNGRRHSPISGSLQDRGANGGIAGHDMRVLDKIPGRYVNIRGVDNHELTEIPLVTAAGVIDTSAGPHIGIFHQYAHHPKQRSIHSSGQMEHFGNHVNDRSCRVGGTQRIVTPDGITLPLCVHGGLPYLPLRPPTDHELETFPHIIMTSDDDWDPTVLDFVYGDDDDVWHDAITNIDELSASSYFFDEFGNYRFRVVASHNIHDCDPDDVIDACLHDAHSSDNHFITTTYLNFEHHISRPPPDYDALAQYFGWLPTNIIKQTLAHTTQWYRTPASTIYKILRKSPFPAYNIPRRNEDVATDTIFSDVPAIDNGSTMAQMYVGTTTHVRDAYGMKREREFANTLEDCVRERGAMNRLLSDRASVEISERVKNFLRFLIIGAWQSEPHMQHQNPYERSWQTVKHRVNVLLDRSGAPPYTWFLCLTYVLYLLNNTYNDTISAIPLSALTGSTTDCSPLLQFYWWQKVKYRQADATFPSESLEGSGRFVGFADNVGHAMTFKILTDDTRKVIYRSRVRPDSAAAPNFRADLLRGEDFKDIIIDNPVLKFKHEIENQDDNVLVEPAPPKFNDGNIKSNDGNIESNDENINFYNPGDENTPLIKHVDIIGRTFLMPEGDDGQVLRAKIIEAIDQHEDKVKQHPAYIKFRVNINDDQYDEIMSYEEIMDHIAATEDNNIYWKYKRIVAHQGPLARDDPDYNGSSYNIMVEWENGERTYEPLSFFGKDDPVACAIYGKEHNLLNKDGWKQFRRISKTQKKLNRFINQAKLRSFRTSPKYKFGYEVPRDYAHAIRLDKSFGTLRWRNAITTELEQLHEYDTFIDIGHKSNDHSKRVEGYKKIKTHLVFDVKHDGRHKARMVADGHLTDVPVTSVYSGVVSLRGLRIMIFLAELNLLDTWATDIGNAYLEAKTSEKVYIIAGAEFGELQDHVLIIYKALYGLRSSGARWHERFADCLREMGFQPCWAEPDIWMRKDGDVWEYIGVYVDDLAIVSRNPKTIIDTLTGPAYNFKLKGTGTIAYHLGMDFYRDNDGTLVLSASKYIDKMMDSYYRIFGTKPSTVYRSPLEPNDHPELDASELLDDEWHQKYQSMVGQMQWAVSIGRIDITTAVMTMSSYSSAPRKGHLERLKRIYGYLKHYKTAAIRIRTHEPDISDLPTVDTDWSYSVYGDGEEEIPFGSPEPLGNYVTLIHYFDANLLHNLLSGKAATGILHLINGTPIDWFSKKQGTPESATYASEFIAGRTCVEQVADLRITLHYLGVPIRGKSVIFGDNQSMVNSSMDVFGKISKRHVMLSYHIVRYAVAHKIVSIHHVDGKINPSDILTKHWSHADVWTQLQPLMFHSGDTAVLLG